ncbi:MAG: class I SAM-dependent methyltransferase [Microthrixaceae bacterium]
MSGAGVSVAGPAALDESLRLLRKVAAEQGADGYVPLSTNPYRGHHLLAAAVLDHTPPDGVVLEGGVSSGYFARVLTAAGRTVDGVELDPAEAEVAAAVCRRVHVGDLGTVGPADLAGPYDALVFGDTLEHLVDPSATLRRLTGALRPGGVVVASIPNVAEAGNRLRLLRGRWDYADRGILDRTHLRFFTHRTVQDLFTGAGLEVLAVDGYVRAGLAGERWSRAVHRVGNLRPGFFAYTFVVVARTAG